MIHILTYFKKLFLLDANGFPTNHVHSSRFHHVSAIIMSMASLLVLLIALVVNWYQHNYEIMPPLIFTTLLVLAGIIWQSRQPYRYLPLCVASAAFLFLGFYLLFYYGELSQLSILCFLLSPPIIMFCLGLRWGTALFIVCYLLLMMFFFAPLCLRASAAHGTSTFFLAILGTFFVSWVAEFVRHRMACALNSAIARLEKDAITDALTGLGNRRDFTDHFHWLQAQSKRSDQPFAIIMADIDHFKFINDEYGHQIGDMMIKHIATLLHDNLRDADRVFRWGGEEFIILLPGANLVDGALIAERLRITVAASIFSYENLKIRCTISLGVYCGLANESLDEQVKKADDRLYRAKNRGRNQTTAY